MLRAANHANEMQRNLPWYEEQETQADQSEEEGSSSSCDGAKGGQPSE